MIMMFLWNEIFFRPLLNLLIGLYNTVGLQNLGLAIVWLTVMIRLALLPLSLREEQRRKKMRGLEQDLAELQKHYGNNPAILREEQKELLKKYKFRRWPKVLTLAIQGFVLLILYQVFLGGIRLSNIVDSLYAFVHVPRSINTMLLGIDISEPSFIMSFVTASILLASLIYDHGGIRARWTSRDMLFAFGLPAATFVILWWLPAVKALFVLASLLFTLMLRSLTAFFAGVKEQDRLIKEQKEAKKKQRDPSVPHPKDRFK